MATESNHLMRKFWFYFIAATIFFSLVVSIVVISKIYLNDSANQQSFVSTLDSINRENGESVPLQTGSVVRDVADNSYEARLQELDDRITETQNTFSARSRQLENWLGTTQNAYEARFEQIEQRIVSKIAPNDVTTTINPFPTLDAHESRLKQLEVWMYQNREVYKTRLADTEEDLYQNQETTSNILKEMDLRDIQANDPYEGRLQNMEQKLDRTVEEFKEELRKIEKYLANTASRLDDLSAAVVTEVQHKDTIAAINEATKVSPPAAPNIGHASQPDNKALDNPTVEDNLAKRKPYTIEEQDLPQSQNSGNWAINLASYTSKRIAASKMTEFHNNGVMARMTSAIVHGDIIYRLQVVGFDSFEAAKLAAPSIRQRLNLDDTWITKI